MTNPFLTRLQTFLADPDCIHIMLDCETGSLGSKAAITSIGVVEFRWSVNEEQIVRNGQQYIQVHQLAYATEELYHKFDVDLSTIQWRNAKLPTEEGPFLMPEDAAKQLASIVRDRGKPVWIWAKPTKFDVPIVDNFLQVFDCDQLDRHRLCDLETVCWTNGFDIKDIYDKLEAPSSAHHALEDCIYQLDVLDWLVKETANR